MRLIAAALGVTLVLSACGSDASTTTCTIGTGPQRVCYETSSTNAGSLQTQVECEGNGGVFSSTCSHTGADGGCRISDTTAGITVTSTQWSYTGDPALEKSHCERAGGVWILP